MSSSSSASILDVEKTKQLIEHWWHHGSDAGSVLSPVSSPTSTSSSLTSDSHLSSHPSSILSTLCSYIRIPNCSPQFDPNVFTNGLQEQAVEVLINWAKKQPVTGMKVRTLSEAGRTPCILITVEPFHGTNGTGAAASAECGSGAGGAGTGSAANGEEKESDSCEPIFMYGHLDKQPPLTSGWSEGLSPYTPVIRDGKLYGRGGADDGYAIFAAVSSIAALQAQQVSHTKIVILIEACEESGSRDLLHYLDRVSDEIRQPSLVVCLDSGCCDYDRFWLTSSLRGMLLASLRVQILTEAVHSGQAAGIVPSSFRILRSLLDRIEDSQTGKLVELCSVPIPDEHVKYAEEVAQTVGELIWQKFAWVKGAKPKEPIDLKELILNNTWGPFLAVTGIDGIPSLVDAGNVLRNKTHIKMSIRLPPTADPMTVGLQLKSILEEDPPYGSQVELTIDKAQGGWAAPSLPSWLQSSLDRASEQYFHQPLRVTGEGGSIPFIKMLAERYPSTSFVITGVLGPGSNAHGPNEFLHIDMAKKLTGVVAALVADHNQHSKTQGKHIEKKQRK